MYPFQHPQPYLRRQWYAVALSDEVGRVPLERTVCDEPLLLYRTEAGTVTVLHGVCPHRMLPLSRGSLQGDEVVCAYHGFSFDPSGRCTRIPSQATPPASFRMRTFPAVEQGGFVWVWMGNAQQEVKPMPDIAAIGIGAPGWTGCGYSHIPLKARWSLLLDNLFDLSHISWVHAKSIPPSDIMGVIPTVDDTADRFFVERATRNAPKDDFNRWMFPHASDRQHATLFTDLVSPGIINAGSTVVDAANDQLLGRVNFIHIVTPETAHSCHYFGVVTRDFRLDDAALSAALGAQDNGVRAEDRVTLEAIEPLADRFGDPRRELSAQVDAGAIRLRRRLDAMLAAEAAQA